MLKLYIAPYTITHSSENIVKYCDHKSVSDNDFFQCLENQHCKPGINLPWLWYIIICICIWDQFAYILSQLMNLNASILDCSFVVSSLPLIEELMVTSQLDWETFPVLLFEQYYLRLEPSVLNDW